MTDRTDVLRTAMLDAAEQQLVSSPDYELATRPVCEAVGVTQPVLYRLFGDKRGLLDALADRGLERYSALKSAQAQTADPVADLEAGWDEHMQFAASSPALYQLMFAPRPWARSVARARILDLLEGTLVRCAAAGTMRVEPHVAAQLILSANVGLALNLIAAPDLFHDQALSHQMRASVFSHVLSKSPARRKAATVETTALQLRSQIHMSGTNSLNTAETALLTQWLERLGSS